MGGASFGGGMGGGGGIEVPAVRDSEMDASSFGSLKRDVGVRLGPSAVGLSDSMVVTNCRREENGVMRAACVVQI